MRTPKPPAPDMSLPPQVRLGIYEGWKLGWKAGFRAARAAQAKGGKKGGSAVSDAKREAARANGKRGGRPRKVIVTSLADPFHLSK